MPSRPSRPPNSHEVGHQAGTGGGTQEDGWGDDELNGELDLSRGGLIGSGAGPGNAQSSAYSGGSVSFDDDPFADAVPDGALELDVPSHHTANTNRSLPIPTEASPSPTNRDLAPASSAPFGNDAPPPSTPRPAPPPAPPSPQPGPSNAAPAPPRPPPPAPPPDRAAAMIARYPARPTNTWETPLYAMKVLLRQIELRQDLASLRKRRSPDVPLYERALKTHDAKTFAVGLAIACALFAIASFLFFLPVLLRFLRNPD